MKITNNQIDEAKNWPSPNHGGVIRPKIVIIHYTDSNNIKGDLSWLSDPKSQVSTHLVIGKAGELYQMIPFNIRAWHAGVSNYKGKQNCNGFSVGIENVGKGDGLWPQMQINKLLECLKVIVSTYKIEAIVGHSDVAPGRKIDPGNFFPWSQVKTKFPNIVVHKVMAI